VDARLNPFTDFAGSRYVAGGLAIDPSGALVYDVMELDPSDPWGSNVVGAWLVRIAPDGTAARADFGSLVSGEPLANDLCQGSFSRDQRPWPPSPDALPPSLPCGSQRPGVNVVPAIAPDGTIYTVSRAHRNSRYASLIAARPDLAPIWSVSLRMILNDGCGVLVPIGTENGCRAGAHLGVDPATNDRPAGRVVDLSTASPVVLPDGAADDSLPQLGGKTPLQVARIPHMDRVASIGRLGRIVTIPEGFTPGTDVGTLTLLGFDPLKLLAAWLERADDDVEGARETVEARPGASDDEADAPPSRDDDESE
jgi:hypothetical protein